VKYLSSVALSVIRPLCLRPGSISHFSLLLMVFVESERFCLPFYGWCDLLALSELWNRLIMKQRPLCSYTVRINACIPDATLLYYM
jgi:hypothetical protein